MKKPIIVVTPRIDDSLETVGVFQRYLEAVRHGGGTPVILPYSESEEEIEELVRLSDGVLFTGGGDIDPKYYGEGKLPCCNEPSWRRDSFEKLLFDAALRHKKPILGICRGVQVINVMLDGTLYQDIDTQTEPEVRITHGQEKPYDSPAHNVKLTPDSPLRGLAGSGIIMVNSIHHQAIKKLGRGLKAAAYAPDGIIEAVYMPEERFVWGVQWHPEYLFEKDAVSASIFRAFTDACGMER